MTNPKSPERLVNIDELAEQLGLSKATLYRWRSTGYDMPKGIKIGGHVRWHQSTIDAWIEEKVENS